MDKIKYYFDLERLPMDISEQDAMEYFRPNSVPFCKNKSVLSFTPLIKRGNETFHEYIIHEIRKRKIR